MNFNLSIRKGYQVAENLNLGFGYKIKSWSPYLNHFSVKYIEILRKNCGLVNAKKRIPDTTPQRDLDLKQTKPLYFRR